MDLGIVAGEELKYYRDRIDPFWHPKPCFIQGIWGANQALFVPETKKRASGEYARISCMSEMSLGRPSPVSAAKKDASDEDGDQHIRLLDAEKRPFVSSG